MVCFRHLSLFVALLATLWALARTHGGVNESSLSLPSGSDPEYSVDLSLLNQAVSCPTHVEGPKGVILLVHGTGVTPQINWDDTLLPPLTDRGFQPCYVAVPERLLLDSRRGAEFVSYAIKKVANEYPSSGGVSIVSWSAGALVTQWTLAFHPETRAIVKQHIAPGTLISRAVDDDPPVLPKPILRVRRPAAAVVQLFDCAEKLRRYPSTRANHEHRDWHRTSTDQVVQPGFFGEWLGGYHDAWRLNGPLASNVDLFKVCLPKTLSKGKLPRFFTHESLLWEAASHKLIFVALENSETFVGTANAIESDDCEDRLAPGLKAEWKDKHVNIMPEIFKYAQTLGLAGWPEVPSRDYAAST